MNGQKQLKIHQASDNRIHSSLTFLEETKHKAIRRLTEYEESEVGPRAVG